jgi:hypothetical protein
MTSIELSHSDPAHGLVYRIGQRISDLLEGIAEARALADRYRTLSHMSDEELAKRGLKRREIPHAILTGAGL